MPRLTMALAALAIGLIIGSGPALARPVLTDAGRLAGVREEGLTVFKGVPYAAPPLGDLRWRPPQAPGRWRGVRRAATFAPACPQKGVSMPGEAPPRLSEDCLYLNIWTPAARAGARRPVIVWIHGGGFTNGSASMPLYWGDRLAARGVVVLTVAYRLGPLGFLAHPGLEAESADRSAGNYGLMDQIAALRWVRRNIAAFGGDPSNVTIAGQSAGAMSVSLLMASPQARGLFHRAIAQSGGVFEPLQLAPGFALANAVHDGETYAAAHGAPTLAALRALPWERLLEGSTASVSHPVIGGGLLPEPPYDTFAAGRQNDVPLLLGSNAEEARSLADLSGVKAASFEADLAATFGPLPPPLMAAYPHATDTQARQARADFERDLRFGWDMWAWARLQAAKGRGAVFYYQFTRRPPFPAGSVYEGWGASHFAELWYMFGHLAQSTFAWSPRDRALSDQMVGYWVNFARAGDPNVPGLPGWPAFKGQTGATLYLGDDTRVGEPANLAALRVFDAVYAQVRASR
jgi:para-nitrobenzyl esterase